MNAALRWYLRFCEGGHFINYEQIYKQPSYAINVWRKEIPILLLITAKENDEYWLNIKDFIDNITLVTMEDPLADFNKFISDLFSIKFRLQGKAIRNHRILKQYFLKSFNPSDVIYKIPFFLENNKNFVGFMLYCKFDDNIIWKSFVGNSEIAYSTFTAFTDISIKEKKWKHIKNRIIFLMYILQDVQLIYEQIQPRALKLIAIISNALVVAPPNYQQELIYMAISALKVYWQYASKNEFHNAITLVLNSAIRTQYYYTMCKFNEMHQGGISKKKVVKLICDRGLKYPVDFDIISEYSNNLDSATLITAVTALYNLGTENEIFTRISISLIFSIALKLGDKIDVRNYFADVIRKIFTLIGCLSQNNQNESLVLILCETLSSFTQNNVYWLQQCLISCFSSLKASKNSPDYFDALFKVDSSSSSKPVISRRTTIQERCQSTPKIPRLSLSDMNNSKTIQSRSRPNTSRDKMKLMTSSTKVANVSLTERRKEIPKSPRIPAKKGKNSNTLSKTTEIGPSIVVTSVKKLL